MAIDAETLKNLSPKVKALLLAVAYALIAYFYYFFILQASFDKKATLQTKFDELSQQVDEQNRIAAQKSRHLRDVSTLQETFQIALTKLPDKREIQPLFQAVATLGKSAGLEFLLFEPKPPPKPQAPKPTVKENLKPSDQKAEQKPADGKAPPPKTTEPDKFYEDIPVTVTISGRFHDTLSFFEKVAKLPRIINIESISMGEGADVKGRGWVIKTNCIIKTYMFIDKPR